MRDNLIASVVTFIAGFVTGVVVTVLFIGYGIGLPNHMQ